MIATLAVAGAALAWLGAATLLLSDDRRGLAVGLAVVGAGLALSTSAAGQDRMAAATVALGGVASGALHLGRGTHGWGLMRPGSTPRVIGSLVALILTVVVAGAGVHDLAGVARLGGLVVAALAAGRLLTVTGRWVALGAGSALALGLGAFGGGPALVLAAAVAVALGLIDLAGPAEAAA